MQPASSSPLGTADFGSRWSAFAIDASILFIAQWMIFMVLSRQLQAAGMTSEELCIENGSVLCEGPSTALWALLLLMLVATTLGYHAVFEGLYGATPGKRWMGLKVVNANDESPIGLAAGMQRSFVRQLFWLTLFFVFDASPFDLGLPTWLFALLPCLALIALASGAFVPDGRSLHDHAARTMVVRSDWIGPAPRDASPIPPPPIQQPAPSTAPSANQPPPPTPADVPQSIDLSEETEESV